MNQSSNQDQAAVPPADQAPIENVGKSATAYVSEHYRGWIILFAVMALVIVVAAVREPLFAPAIIPLIIFPAVGILVLRALAFIRLKRIFTQQFGASIGFSYSPTCDMASMKGKLFELGYSRRCGDILSGTRQGLPMRIFTYTFTQGSGKNRKNFSFTVFEVAFKAKMREITLVSRQSSGFFSDLLLGGNVRLEGDFSKYFSLHVPDGYEQEAYELFTPDRMATLIDKARGFNFQFIDDRLYIYRAGVIQTREGMDAAFALADYLAESFQPEIESL